MRTHVLGLLLLPCLLPAVANAQAQYAVDKGSMVIRGSGAISSAGGDLRGDDRITTISLRPGLVYFIAPHVGIGGTLRIVSQSAGDQTTTSFGVGPTISYHFGDADSKSFPFIEFSPDFISVSDAFTQLTIAFSAGIDVMIAENISFGPAFTFQFEQLSPDGSDETVNGTEIFIGAGFRAWVF